MSRFTAVLGAETKCICGLDHLKPLPQRLGHPVVLCSDPVGWHCHICQVFAADHDKLKHDKTCLYGHDTKKNRARAAASFRRYGSW